MDHGGRDGRRRRFEAATEGPMLLLALAMVPLLVVPLAVDLPPAARRAVVAADWVVWGAFALHYLVRLGLASHRWGFVRREWQDLLIVALPFLRPLRVVRSAGALRALRLARLGAVLGEVWHEGRRLLGRHHLGVALVVTAVTVVGGAGLTFAVEQGGDGSIETLGDALWWAVTTVTTVGYGDAFPVTAAGRWIATVLMLAGIALFGVVTANLAALLVERDVEPEQSAIERRLEEVIDRLERIERKLEAGGPT